MSERVSFVAKKMEGVPRSSLLYVNSPTRRNPANATRQAAAKFRSSLRSTVMRNRLFDSYFGRWAESSRAIDETAEVLIIKEFIIKKVINVVGPEGG